VKGLSEGDKLLLLRKSPSLRIFEKYKSFGKATVLNQPNDFSKKTRIYSLFFDITSTDFYKESLNFLSI
jgi:hypothetical protein